MTTMPRHLWLEDLTSWLDRLGGAHDQCFAYTQATTFVGDMLDKTHAYGSCMTEAGFGSVMAITCVVAAFVAAAVLSIFSC